LNQSASGAYNIPSGDLCAPGVASSFQANLDQQIWTGVNCLVNIGTASMQQLAGDISEIFASSNTEVYCVKRVLSNGQPDKYDPCGSTNLNRITGYPIIQIKEQTITGVDVDGGINLGCGPGTMFHEYLHAANAQVNNLDDHNNGNTNDQVYGCEQWCFGDISGGQPETDLCARSLCQGNCGVGVDDICQPGGCNADGVCYSLAPATTQCGPVSGSNYACDGNGNCCLGTDCVHESSTGALGCGSAGADASDQQDAGQCPNGCPTGQKCCPGIPGAFMAQGTCAPNDAVCCPNAWDYPYNIGDQYVNYCVAGQQCCPPAAMPLTFSVLDAPRNAPAQVTVTNNVCAPGGATCCSNAGAGASLDGGAYRDSYYIYVNYCPAASVCCQGPAISTCIDPQVDVCCGSQPPNSVAHCPISTGGCSCPGPNQCPIVYANYCPDGASLTCCEGMPCPPCP
jgi:hypothetical protein